MLGFFCLNFTNYFFITWFPSYLVQTRGFSLKSLGTLGMIPALMAIPGGWIGGFVSDALYRRGWSLTAARKTCMSVVFRSPSTMVPSHHFSGSVLACRNGALKPGVLQRVVLDVNGHPPFQRLERRPSRHRPRDEDAVDLEPEVVVQRGRAVALHHEPPPGLGRWRSRRGARTEDR